MYTKRCIISILLLVVLQLHGQTPSIQKGVLPVVIPPSPEATMISRFGNIPVSYYTGTPEISIPIYSVKVDNLEIPISLNYHASGIKVADEGTWVGLGWDLSTGGAITVEVQGKRDLVTYNYNVAEYNSIISDFYPNRDLNTLCNIPSDIRNIPFNPTQGKLFNKAYSGIIAGISGYYGNYADYQPDYYQFNFPGHSGKFLRDIRTGKYVLLDQQSDLIITPIPGSSVSEGGFIITGSDGAIYTFERKEWTAKFLDNLEGTSQDVFHLTKIQLPSGKKIIYNYGTSASYLSCSCTESVLLSKNAGYMEVSGLMNYSTKSMQTTKYFLTSITTPTEIISFQLGARLDITAAPKLDKIDIKSTVTNTLVKSFQFSYDYFAGGSDNNALHDYSSNSYPPNTRLSDKECIGIYGGERMKRLKLTKIQEVSPDINTNASIKPYIFDYIGGALPSKTSYAVDHWGYYNGADNNQSFLPNIGPLSLSGSPDPSIGFNYIQGATGPSSGGIVWNYLSTDPEFTNFLALGGSNRGATNNLATVSVGTLYKITYPTGGFSTFEYELHKYNKGGSDAYSNRNYMTKEEIDNHFVVAKTDAIGGGLRIKRIYNIDNDALNTNLQITDYKYVTKNGNSTGKLMTPINYTNKPFQLFDEKNNCDNQNYFRSWSVFNKTSSSTTSTALQSALIGYDSVQVYKYDGTLDKIAGKTVYCYNNNYPYGYLNDNPLNVNWLNGKLSFERIYQQNKYGDNPVIQKETKYTYKDISINAATGCGKLIYGLMGKKVGECQDAVNGACYECFDHSTKYLVTIYSILPNWYSLDQTTEKEFTYLSGNPANITTKVTQNTIYNASGLVEQQVSTLPDGRVYTNTSKYPVSTDIETVLIGNSSAIASKNQLLAIHNVTPPLYKELTLSNAGVSTTINKERTDYKIINDITGNLVYPVPAASYYSSGNGPLEKILGFDIYDAKTNLIQVSDYKGNINAYKWGYGSLLPTAKIVNARSNEFFTENFEDSNVAGVVSDVNNAHTGVKYYNGSSYTVNWTTPNSRQYSISYWFYGSNGKWNFSGIIPYTGTSYTLTSGSKYDDIKIYPSDAQVNMYTHAPLIGVTSTIDPNDNTIYYEFDELGRLRTVKDRNKSILSKNKYRYKD